MAITSNLQIRRQFPFPSLVIGTGPIVVGKQNGIWAISLNISGLSVQTPPTQNYATDFVPVWDSVAKTYLQVPLSAFAGLIASTYTYVGATPYTAQTSDSVLGVDTNAIGAPVAITGPLAASRLNVPLTIKDRSNKASRFPITFTPNAADTKGVDGNPTLVINTDGGSATILPVNDTFGNGWVRTG